MNPKPILFSTPMVQAIVAGNKTQTRRIVKLKGGEYNTVLPLKAGGYMFTTSFGNRAKQEQERYDKNGTVGVQCPYSVGQVLWVRETWADASFGKPINPQNVAYKADYSEQTIQEPRNKGLWKPSIFMPKTAARIFLQVTEVRVEKLKEISLNDCSAEGVHADEFGSVYDKYRELWIEINGEESYFSNPWVWVITFERIEKPENF